MTINAHLRNEHGYSLAESIRQAPHVMAEIHEMEHQEGRCNHRHTQENGCSVDLRQPDVRAPGTA